MRRVVYSHMVSLDGYIEANESYTGPNWAVSDEEIAGLKAQPGGELALYGSGPAA